MRRLASLMLIVLALAGCAAPGADVDPADEVVADPNVSVVARASIPRTDANATTPVADAAASPPVALPPPVRIPFAPPVELPITPGFGGGEPNIAALPDGTLFVAAPTGGAEPNAHRGGGYLWRSQDHGATWEMLRGPSGSPAVAFCSCDSDVVTSPDGWVYYSDWWIAGFAGPGNYLVERSSDGGETWEATPITTREAVRGVDRQWLVAGEGGFVGLFYSYYSPISSGLLPDVVGETQSGIHAVFSHDHGATWSDPVVVMGEGSWQIAHPRLMPDGTLVMPYGLVPDAGGFWRDPSLVMLAVSNDEGQTWEHHQVAEAPEGFDNLWAVQADVDTSGAVHVAWAARVDDDIIAQYVATSRDVGKTWTEPLALRAEGLNFLPWVATFGNGTVAVGWYGGDATGDPKEADADWFAYVAESTDGGETFVVHKVSEEPVKSGAFCPTGAQCSDDRELLDYVSLAYDAEGYLHYAYARSVGGEAQTLVSNELAVTVIVDEVAE